MLIGHCKTCTPHEHHFMLHNNQAIIAYYSGEGIVVLLSSGFAKLVLIANIIALPAAWWLMNQWLQGFPYHIDVNLFVLLFSGLLVVLIGILSVSYQTVKAALVSPANTLRYE